MKTQNTKLAFKTNSISELNGEQLNQIQGGTVVSGDNSLSCSLCINSSNGAGGDIIKQMRVQ